MKFRTFVCGAIIAISLACHANESMVANDKMLLEKVAKEYVQSVIENDKKAFSSLYVDYEAYIKFRINNKLVSELSSKKAYAKSRGQYLHDLNDIRDLDTGFGVSDLSYKGVRILPRKSNNFIYSMEIKVEYSDGFGLGIAYIVTGPLVKSGDKWGFLARCIEPFSAFPVDVERFSAE